MDYVFLRIFIYVLYWGGLITLSTILWQIVLQIILIALNAVFACTEIAVISVNDNKLEKMAAEGNKKAVKLFELTKQPARFLATIQVAITLSGFLGSAFAADNFADLLTELLIGINIPISASTLNSISVIVITLVLSYFTLVFGELVPKRIAMKNAESLALGLSSMISLIAKLCSPIVWLLTISTNGILRLVGIDPNSEEDEVTEEEIRMMVDVGSQNGTIDEDEKEMIQNVFEFDNLTADEIATHRTDVLMLDLDDSMDEWEKTIYSNRHSYYPVCDGTVDDIYGVLHVRDYLLLKDRSRENVIEKAIKPAYFVPHSIRADLLFDNMKNTGHYFAIVLDEYGGVSGIITIYDLIEEIIGDLNSGDLEDNEAAIKQIDPQTWEIPGGAPIDDVAKELQIKLEDGDYDTFGGFILHNLGYIPSDSDTPQLKAQGLTIRVMEVKDHRIIKTLVHIDEKKEDTEEEK